MSAGPTVNVAAVRRRSKSPRSKSPMPAGRKSASQSRLDDRESLAEKLHDMSRKYRDCDNELLVIKSRLQRAEADAAKKGKTIDELLDANAGGYSDASSVQRTQQQIITTLKARVSELEGMLLEKEGALQKVLNQPDSYRMDELDRECKIYCMEVRRLQKALRDGGGAASTTSSGSAVDVGNATEWAQLKKESASLKLAKAEMAEQLEWAQADRDEALSKVAALEAELAGCRKQVREGRSSLARLQVRGMLSPTTTMCPHHRWPTVVPALGSPHAVPVRSVSI